MRFIGRCTVRTGRMAAVVCPRLPRRASALLLLLVCLQQQPMVQAEDSLLNPNATDLCGWLQTDPFHIGQCATVAAVESALKVLPLRCSNTTAKGTSGQYQVLGRVTMHGSSL